MAASAAGTAVLAAVPSTVTICTPSTAASTLSGTMRARLARLKAAGWAPAGMAGVSVVPA